MFRITSYIFVAVCAVICASDPILNLPILQRGPTWVDFKLGEEFLLECFTDIKDGNIKYSWLKDGKPFTPNADVIQREKEGTLVFKKPVDSDQGQYQCLAETPLGTARSGKIAVKKIFIDTPQVTQQKHKPVEGKTYKLDCNIPNAHPKPTIIWTRKSLTNNDESEVFDQRLTISPEGTLYFSNVSNTDVGYKFTCKAKHPAHEEPIILAEHIISELEPNKGQVNNDVIKQYVSNDVTAKVGDVTYLYCIYGGNPLAHPDWFKDGKDVNNGPKDRVTRHNKSVGKRLLIKDTWLSDQGEYTCVVDNEVGKSDKHTMHLTVVSPPLFTRKFPTILKVKRGDDVTIPCEAAGVPSPQLSWSHNTRDVNDQIERDTRGDITVANLRIRNASPEQNGYYGCTATNEHGENYTETLLYVQ